jgi:hypothetical protein
MGKQEEKKKTVNDSNDDGAGNHLFQAVQERGNTKTKQSRYVDSDATSHMTSNKSLLSELYKSENIVFLADDSGVAVKGISNGVITPDVITALDGHIQANRRITVEEISLLMGISHGSAHALVTKHLLYCKICMQ